MATLPTEWTKRYYSIGEVARIFEVNTSTLRFWEKEFPELSPKKMIEVSENTPPKTWKRCVGFTTS